MNIRTFATPLTIASFITICTTGTLMLFGFHGGLVGTVHEVSSVIFILSSALHIFINFKSTLLHIKRPLGASLAVVFLTISVLSILPLGSKKENPRKAYMQASELLLGLSPLEIASISKQSKNQILDDLKRSGFQVNDETATLRSIAVFNKREPFEAIAAATMNIPLSKRH